jgi:putative transposase
MTNENGSRGYDRIAGALANLGHHISDQTVGNVFKRHGIPAAPKRSRSTALKDFISAHIAVLAGTDFFTVEVHPGSFCSVSARCRGIETAS